MHQLFQLVNSICAYGDAFYGLTRMLYTQKCKQGRQQRFAYRQKAKIPTGCTWCSLHKLPLFIQRNLLLTFENMITKTQT